MNAEQVNELRALVARARAQALTAEEHAQYLAACRNLERSLTRAQHLLAPPGATPRRRFRVVRELEVELELKGGRRSTRTTNFSAGGFCARMGDSHQSQPPPLQVGDKVGFSLSFAPGTRPLQGRAVCRAVWKARELWHGSFQFDELAPEVLARLELEMVAVALEMLWPSGSLGP